jgi:D-sedoheptulose 7-phosphate isomerase
LSAALASTKLSSVPIQDSLADSVARVRAALAESAQTQRATAEACAPAIAEAARRMAATFRAGGRVLAFGNGGSAADAQHLAAELAGRFERERPGLPALALTANTSDLTAIGNDYGFDEVFARLVRAHGRSGDLAVAISTSGNSPNVLAGVAAAREVGLTSLALTGKGGGKLAAASDLAIVVPSGVTARIQESHIAVIHLLCELCDDELFPASGRR